MTREEAKRRAELYSALADGKTIQILNMEGNWVDVEVKKLNYIPETLKFRIKLKLIIDHSRRKKSAGTKC